MILIRWRIAVCIRHTVYDVDTLYILYTHIISHACIYDPSFFLASSLTDTLFNRLSSYIHLSNG